MKIAIGCDHGGYELKEQLRRYLSNNGHEVVDCGTDSVESVHYPVFAKMVAKKVQRGDVDYIDHPEKYPVSKNLIEIKSEMMGTLKLFFLWILDWPLVILVEVKLKKLMSLM
jgi:hypothetical protein